MKSQNWTCQLCFNICGNKVKACLTWDVCWWWVVRLWQCGWGGKTCGHSVTMTSSIIMLFWCNETPPHRTHPTILSVSLTTTKQTAGPDLIPPSLTSPRYQIKLWLLERRGCRQDSGNRTIDILLCIVHRLLGARPGLLGFVWLDCCKKAVIVYLFMSDCL